MSIIETIPQLQRSRNYWNHVLSGGAPIVVRQPEPSSWRHPLLHWDWMANNATLDMLHGPTIDRQAPEDLRFGSRRAEEIFLALDLPKSVLPLTQQEVYHAIAAYNWRSRGYEVFASTAREHARSLVQRRM